MSTYGQLKADVSAELAKDTTAQIDRFQRQALQRINRDVRVSDMERRARSSGNATRYLIAPEGALEVRRLWNVVATGIMPQIRQVAPQMLRVSQSGGRPPQFFCTHRGEPFEIEFDTPLSDEEEVEMVYAKAYDLFVNNDDTNWLLANHYDVYLQSMLEAADMYFRNYESAPMRRQQYVRALTELDRSERRQMYMQPQRAQPNQPVF